MNMSAAGDSLLLLINTSSQARVGGSGGGPSQCPLFLFPKRTRLQLHCSNPHKSRRVGNGVGIKSQLLQVISIGSRKDALLDFCLNSPFQSSSSLQFWSIHTKDSSPDEDVQLHQRVIGKDLSPRTIQVPQLLQLCSKAIVLVASAGYGSYDAVAIDIIEKVRSRNGLAMAILMKPFSFEGKRRQDEVKDLMGKLQELTNFCIDIDTDSLLNKDLVTLDEALKTANTAVLLAINAISLLISETHQKKIGRLHNVKKLGHSELLKILDSYGEAKIGFGVGANIRSSILQALYDCPFIDPDFGVLNGVFMCVLASSGVLNDRDLNTALHTLHEAGDHTGDIIISVAHEPNLEPNLVVTTVAIMGSVELQTPPRSNIFSRLAQHFPFISKLLGRHHEPSNQHYEGNNLPNDPCPSDLLVSPYSGEMEQKTNLQSRTVDGEHQFEELETVLRGNYSEVYVSSGTDESEMELLEARTESSKFDHQSAEGISYSQMERLDSWNLALEYQIKQNWGKEKDGASLVHDNISMFHLPIGVRHPEESDNGLNISPSVEFYLPKTEENVREQTHSKPSISHRGALAGDSVAPVRDFGDASTPLSGRKTDSPKKQGVLSFRAASMLEAERDSPKKWSPMMEMQYRGGVYQGRCQGGLPEGKGRLILGDGSTYDGIWRYGKRSGPGAFYFTNGDVFQGLWRDDVMHGKGWFYFHTGDRWFANFWKGKANGESRFYSKCGDIVFGNFRNGWRDGKFLCINVDGARSVEMWNEGIFVSREQLDSDTDAG